jgi:hypothetical protein
MAVDRMRAVVWKNLLLNGTDYCALWRTPEGWLLKGTAISALKGQRPMLANYEIQCDDNWLTRRVQMQRTIGKDTKTLVLNADGRGVWNSSGQALNALRCCLDIDLAVTAATNTLPIRRLNLGIRKSESVTAAWIRFPELEIRPLSQRYTQTPKNNYRYASDTGFSAEIVVDNLGLVITYPSGWERVAAT